MTRGKKKTASGSNKKPGILSGLSDVVPGVDHSWQLADKHLAKFARAYGFARIEVPVIENAALFEDVDLGQKTLIAFNDPEGNKIGIRPETLPGILRAYVESKIMEQHKLSKWYYLTPTYAYDEKQKKYVSSWEYGFELLGEFSPLREVQLISLAMKFLGSLGLENLILEINSVGRTECRENFDDSLRSFLQSKKYDLCNDCVAALEDYPMQVFRCKNLECQTVAAEAPQIMDALDEDCHKHFAYVLEALDELGVAYSLNPMLVGKQGSSRTIFTIKYKDEHSEYFIGEGSYHEDVMKDLTGKDIACFGFIGYMDVLQRALQNRSLEHHVDKTEVFLVPLGDLASKKSLRLFSELWDHDISVHDHFGENGVKNQLKLAEAQKAIIALIMGQKEAMDEMVILRDVKSGMQEVFQYERIIEEVKKRLGK
jgi:histidyl-tRNA synthetase